MTPLPLAIVKGHDEIALILIEAGADVTAKNKVSVCCVSCLLSLRVIAMLYTAPFLSFLPSFLHPSIHFYSSLIHPSPPPPFPQLGITPLLLAVDMNQEEIAFKLIEAGAELMAKNKRQYTALHLAISNAMFDVAVRLIESGASLNAKEWVRSEAASPLCVV